MVIAKERPTVPGIRRDPPDEIVARRMRVRRLALGLNQDDVSDALYQLEPDNPEFAGGKTQTAISNYETMRRAVPIPTLRNIARVLNTSVAYLVGETATPDTWDQQIRKLGVDPGNFAAQPNENLVALVHGILQQLIARPAPGTEQDPEPTQGRSVDERDTGQRRRNTRSR